VPYRHFVHNSNSFYDKLWRARGFCSLGL
jgi:hypothetical protein